MLARNIAPARITDRPKENVFIIFYIMLHHFTLKSIKCTFWPGILPLQGSPTGQKNCFSYYFTCFTLNFIKFTFWPGNLPLQGSPTGQKKSCSLYFTVFYTNIDKMHMLARNFAPARITDRPKKQAFIICYTILHYFTDKSIKCTFWPGILPL